MKKYNVNHCQWPRLSTYDEHLPLSEKTEKRLLLSLQKMLMTYLGLELGNNI